MLNKQSMLGLALAVAVAASGCVGPFAQHAAGGGKTPGTATSKGQKAAKPAETPGAGTAKAGGKKRTAQGAPPAASAGSRATPTPQTAQPGR